MSYKKIIADSVLMFLGIVALGALAAWLGLIAARDRQPSATAIARADSTLAARPIGRASFVKADSFDIASKWLGVSRDTFTHPNILPIGGNVFFVFTDSVRRVGEQEYMSKVNDSMFVTVRLSLDSVKLSWHELIQVMKN